MRVISTLLNFFIRVLEFFKLYPVLYKIIVIIFNFVVNVYYHTVQCCGLEYFPQEGIPTILLGNHGNSLIDALILVTKTQPKSHWFPRVIRMVAKDTLWNEAFFGLFCRIMNGVPIKRGKDHGGARQDNTSSMENVFRGLEDGSCICFFPEGASRYHPEIAAIKTGTARTALELLKRNIDNRAFKLHIVIAGLSYTHREKFRSSVCVQYSKPIVLKGSDFPKSDQDRETFVRTLTGKIEATMKGCLQSAPDWDTVKAANLARSIYAPYGASISLKEHFNLTQQFINIFSYNSDIQMADQSHLTELKAGLLSYKNELDLLGLKDYRIKQGGLSTIQIISRIIVRFLMFWCMGCIIFPGLLILFPVGILAKFLERWRISKGIVDNMDEVMLYKISLGFIAMPIIYCSLCFLTLPLLPISAVFWFLYLWITLRIIEEFFASGRSLWTMIKLLFLPKLTLQKVQKKRSILVDEVNDIAESCNIRKPIPQSSIPGSYFNPFRRRLKDWGEVMRFYSIDNFKED